MAQFDWQTEEEKWSEEPAAVAEIRSRRKRHWSRALLIVLPLAAVLFLTYRAVEQQIARHEQEVRADVLSSHLLISRAVAETDLSLFSSFLSGRDDRWTATQSELVSLNLFGDLSPLGLLGPAGQGQVVEVTLSPDLASAEVVISQTYQTKNGASISETIELQQSTVYRRGRDRWLFAPPDEAFWGVEMTSHGRRIFVTHPHRDEATAKFLIELIDTKLQALCDDLSGSGCPDSRPLVWLSLSTDPRTLLRLADETAMLQDGLNPTLPAPSLVGNPTNDAARQALARGYASLVMRTTMAALLDWSCCQQGLFFRALLDYELNHLGLQAWPMSPADYSELLADWRPLFSEDDGWDDPVFDPDGSPNWRRAHAIVAFLASLNMGLPVADMAQALSTVSYESWLDDFIPSGWTTVAVEQEWRRFVEQNSQAGLAG